MTDRQLLMLVALAIFILALVALASITYLAAVGRPIPDLLVAVASGGVTALAAVLPGARTTAKAAE